MRAHDQMVAAVQFTLAGFAVLAGIVALAVLASSCVRADSFADPRYKLPQPTEFVFVRPIVYLDSEVYGASAVAQVNLSPALSLSFSGTTVIYAPLRLPLYNAARLSFNLHF